MVENDKESGYIYAPYIIRNHTKESLKEYREFMDEYDKNHECCPECGAKEHMTTLIGYVLNDDKKEEYKDLNRCECSNCGDVHTCHERVKDKI